MPNRLADETSPYLRLHADDPVDWYPWGEEAFARARDLSLPIFLSIGYASCHWCHVMHRESFRDTAVAEALNDRFVPIKVDRESRPDVDELYMAYVVAANGHGGWPMSVFLTPRLLPIFGGTYFPPDPAHNLPSFLQVLDDVSEAFGHRPHVADNTAEEALEYLRVLFEPPLPNTISRGLLHRSADEILRTSDPVHGGFGGAPKFPHSPALDFLLAYHQLTGDDRSLQCADRTLRAIVRGGIFDQAGGGIARYTVDDGWIIPHFEKMLYDNAQLLSTLARIQSIEADSEWEHAIRATADFLTRDLSDADGLLFSSLSADTLGEEGATYVWEYTQLAGILTADELALAKEALGVTPDGNWENGRTILTRARGREHRAEAVDAVLGKLLAERQRRPQPACDTKLLVSWNALAARGLLDAGAALHDDGLTSRGLTLVDLLLDRAVTDDGGVVHQLGDTRGQDVRLAEDAAALSLAAAAAHEATGGEALLTTAAELLENASQQFSKSGVWYMTPEATELPLRPLAQHDTPTPASGSLAATAAVKLWRASGDESFRWRAEDALERLTPIAERSPLRAGAALAAVADLFLSGR